jgi:hypothetical protein
LYAYGARYYDPAIGRFTGVDPIADKFPHVSTYNYAENEPIANIDLHGLQKYPAHKGQLFTKKYPHTTAFLQGGGLTRMASSPDIQKAINKWTNGKKSGLQITTDFSFGRGPTLNFESLDVPNGDFGGRMGYSSGYGDLGVGLEMMDRKQVIDIDTEIVDAIEAAIELGDPDAINSALLTFSSTVFHEYTHFGNLSDKGRPMFSGLYDALGNWEEESGYGFEIEVYGGNVDATNATNVYNRERDGNIQNLPIYTELMRLLGQSNKN